MKKIFLRLIVSMVALSMCVDVVNAASATTYSDVPADYWAYGSIQNMADKGIMQGLDNGTFNPEGTITRAEFIAIVTRAMVPDKIDASIKGTWYAANYKAAIDSRLIYEDEMPSDMVSMSKEITRYEMARILVRADESINKNPEVVADASMVKDYTKIDVTIDANRYYVKQAYAKGLLTGDSSGMFNGSQTATRAQAAVVVERLLTSTPSLEIAVKAEKVDEFLHGKAASAILGSDNLWVVQEDGTLWGSGLATGWFASEQRRYTLLGKSDAYDYVLQGNLPEGYPYACFQSYPVQLMEHVKQIDVYDDLNYGSIWAVQKDGSLWGAGCLMNDNSELSKNGHVVYKYTPNFIKVMDDVDSVSANSSILVVKNDGSLWGWGASAYGQLATGSVGVTDWYSPAGYHEAPVKIMDNVVKAVAGSLCSFAIKDDGSLWAWGANRNGQLGNGGLISTIPNEVFEEKPIKIMDDVIDMQVVDYSKCMALKKDGSLWAWGSMPGYYHHEDEGYQSTPQKLADDVSFFAGNVFVKDDRTVWFIEENYSEHSISFEKIEVPDIKSVMRGIAISEDGTLWVVSNPSRPIDQNYFRLKY